MVELQNAAEALRRAVDAGEFADAGEAARLYGQMAARLAASLPIGTAEEHLREACVLLGWARGATATARARLQCMAQYCAGTAEHTWRIEV